MATLERIRQRSGLLLIVIGLAMAAFILTDLFSSGNSVLRNDANKVGEINGKSIDAQEFSLRIDERMELLKAQNPQQAANLSRTMVANQIWTEYQEEILLTDRYADMGISVTNQELFERIISNPQVRSQGGFQDEVTGKFSPASLKNYIANIRDNAATDPRSADAYRQWLSFEDGTRDQAERDKYLYAVRKGIYMPKALAQADYTRRNEPTSIEYFGLEFSSIADSTIDVSESEMKSYYNEHKEEFKSDNTREIAFVTFNVQASESDRAALKSELETYLESEVISTRGRVDTLPSFYDTEDDSTYAVGRSDRPVNPQYKTKEQFTAPMDSILFAEEEGYIYGPYEQNGAYVLAKISDITSKPDSVMARHILLSFQGANQGQSQSTRQPMEAKNLADSLLALVKEDSTMFGELAKKYSDDPGSGAKGGALGWFKPGAMVPSFNDYCFYNEKGDIGLVFSQFGFHIIHIQDQKGANKAIQLVEIAREIEPSDRTIDSIYKKADQFAAKATEMKDFGAAAEEMGYVSRPASNIEPMQESILGIGQNREIVRWIHNEETQLGAIQLFNQNNGSFVVTQLVEIRPEGFLPLDLVKDQVRTAVVNEKKAAQLKADLEAKMGAEIDVKALAVAFSKQVQTQSINFGTSNLTGYGSEPKVIGLASGMDANTMSDVIVGDRGVYVVYVANRTTPAELNSYESEQVRVETAMSNAASAQVLESLKESADIEDMRYKIF